MAPPTPAPSSGASALDARREALERSLSGRFWLRWHASVIVSATFGAGFAANFLLLRVPVHAAVVRWPLAVLVGYAAFFVLVRLWLAYVGIRPFGPGARRAVDDVGSGFDLPSAGSGGSGASSFDLPFRGGGGSSGGAGASASFGPSGGSTSTGSAGRGFLSGLGKSGGGGGGGGGSLLDGLGDDGCLPIVLGLIVLALVVALVGGAIHLVWIAPELLTDAAFAALLTAGAVPGLKRAAGPDWDGRVLRSTVVILLILLGVVIAAGWAFGHYFPGLRTLGEAWALVANGSR